MSDETDVEQLIENFQKTLDSLNIIGNIEALITKLDANKNRKLLKKVKHIVGEVHNKVGTIKERVSKAYKRVKLASSSESEDVLPGYTDKEVGDERAEPLVKNQDVLMHDDDAGRHSPIVGKGKHLERATRQSRKNNTKGNICLESPDDASDGQSKKSADEKDDTTMEDQEENGQRMDVNYSEADNVINSEDVDAKVHADDKENETENSITKKDETIDTESQDSQSVIEATPPHEPADTTKKTVARDLMSAINKFKKLNSSDKDKDDETEDSDNDEECNKSGKKNGKRTKNSNVTSDCESEEPNIAVETSDKEQNISDSDEECLSNLHIYKQKDKVSDGNDNEGKAGSKKGKCSKGKKKPRNDGAERIEEDESNSEVEISSSCKNKTSQDNEKSISETDEAEIMENDEGKKYISDDKDKIKNPFTDSDKAEKTEEDATNEDKETVEKNDKTSKKSHGRKDKKNNKKGKDSDESDNEDKRKNSNDSVVIIEDTPKKVNDKNYGNDSSDCETEDKITNLLKTEKSAHPPVPKIKLVDINKLLAPNKQPLDLAPSPRTKKSVTFDSSVIILSSSDEETPKKDPKNKNQSPLKSAMRKSSSKNADNSDSDSKENNENRRTRKGKSRASSAKKILVSDHSSDDSDFVRSRKGRRLTRHEAKTAKLKDKFAQLATRYGERKTRAAAIRRLREVDEHSDNEVSNRKNKGKVKKANNSDSEDDSEKDSNSVRSKKRPRKKETLETSSLSEQSDHSDMSDFEVFPKTSGPKSRTNTKRAKVNYPEADPNDPKFKAGVFVRLPLFKCEELPEIYKRKKELCEVKKLTKMDFTRRTRSARNGPLKNSNDSDKPEKKRIKLTLKLNRRNKPIDVSSDDDRSSTEDNKDREVEKKDVGKKKKVIVALESIALDEPDRVGVDDDLAEACLEQVKDGSDKEDSNKQSEKSDGDKDGGNKKKDKKMNKKNKENVVEERDGAKINDKENKSNKKDKNVEPKVNGTLSDSEQENDQKDDKKDKNDGSSNEEDGVKKKKGKNWKNDKLLKEKIESSDSDDNFAKFSRKKDKTKSELVRKAKNRMKKSTVISDSESDEDKEKEKKKGKGSDDKDDDDYKADDKSSSQSGSDSEKEDKSEDSEQEEKKKSARKRIKRVKNSSSDEDDKSTRKHIRRMIDRDSLSEKTKKAEQEEKDRKSRIAEKQNKYNQIFDIKADATVEKVVLDFDEKTDEPLLSISKNLAKQLKPHQVQGIKFMWDACFESLARLKKNAGSGCILAHCMGLGKTLQVIALAHALLTNSTKTKVEKIMVVCPVNTVLNWKSEFKKWIPKCNEFEIYELVSCKTSSVNHERNYKVSEWHENGGVLIIGYNMFRTLSNPDNKSISKKLRSSFQEGLVDPGPDLVVCDEGHLLKNEKTHLSIAMNRIRTTRRIVLTGTPLQNNLKEYWCMVQFIKPNLLGTYKEYMNRFVNPITNGQYTDSTQHDTVVMRRRSHVLHKLLDGVVQRQDYSVLEPYLPPKYEYVLFLKLTEVQIKLYSHYMENFARKADGSNRTSFLFTDFQQLQRICTHPRVLLDKSIEDKDKKEHNEDSESEGSLKDFIDDDESEAQSTSSGSDGSESKSGSDTSIKSDEEKKKKKKDKKGRRKRVTRAQAAQNREEGDESDSDVEVVVPKEWWQEYIDNDELDNINHSAKIFLLFEILKECEEIGDKVLVFSQSLYTLNCIEYFLQRIDDATQNGDTEKVGGHSGSWMLGLDYYRLDGSSSCDNRASWCDQFNDPDNTRARLFLISTRAGGLGINLVAANRVIIFDVSWNPSHDIQSIYRVYRFGQTKPSYVYRFVTYGAMEMKIYERQVTKQAISKRVIDEQQIDRHYSQNDVQELYKTDLEAKDRPTPMVPKDVLLGEMLQKYDKTIFKFHEHQSLLENKQDEELNEDERKAAWEEFENEKVIRKTTLTNFGGINLAAFQNQMNFSPQLIQVALANIVRKDNPGWSDVQIRGILPALVTQLQMQMSENDFTMYNRVHQEIRLMQQLQAQRMRERYLQQYQLQQMLQKQQLTNQMLGNLNVTPEELRRLQQQASQNYIQPPPPRSTAGGSGDVIELND